MDYVRNFLQVEGVIGQGAFGQVFVTSPLQNQHPVKSKFALKSIRPILRPSRLASELRHLRDLGGRNNVVRMHSAHFFSGSLFIVMDLIEHERFVDIVGQLDIYEIKLYMKNLLIALEHVHSQNIMHRDIKPANFLFNRKEKKFLLVDFGLAQKMRQMPSKTSTPIIVRQNSKRDAPVEFDAHLMLKKLKVSNDHIIREPIRLAVGAYESPVTQNDRNSSRRQHFSTPTLPRRPQKCNCRSHPKTCRFCSSRPDSCAPKSGTPGYKAIEILLRYQNQTTAIDVWSAGVIFACLLSGHTPFFRDVDDFTSLAEITTILGSDAVIQAAKEIGIRIIIEPKREPIDLRHLCRTIRSNNKDKVQFEIPDDAFDLLTQMLDPNPNTRITAKLALGHPWLDIEN